jgi:uncharacterized protein (DUF1330 family)
MMVNERCSQRKVKNWMKMNLKLMFALLVGVSIGLSGGLGIRGQQVNTPPGYLIAEAEITDPSRLQGYAEKVEETLAPFHHHFVVRSSKVEPLEGDAPKGRFVVIAFDSAEKAREWYDSPAYAAIKPIRQSAAKSRVFIVEGIATR